MIAVALNVGNTFETLKDVSANDVNTSKVATYHKIYKVTDRNSATKETCKNRRYDKYRIICFYGAGSTGVLAVLFGKKRRRNKND